MKILIVVDKYGSAIWRLAVPIQALNPQHEIKIFPVHPKRNDAETIIELQRLMNWADIIDVHYWKSGEILRTSFPKEFNDKPRILFHFNPYDLDKQNWSEIYNKVVVMNQQMYEMLPYSHHIAAGIDLDFFEFNPDYTEEKVVNMVVARIESKKGIAEVAQACHELKYKLLLVGRVSEPAYMQEIIQKYGDVVEFRESVNEEELKKAYYQSAIHVCNSVDGFESGTLPILEAMACGVPVLTRRIGHVPEIDDGTNMVVRNGEKSDVEEIKKSLSEMMENPEWRKKLRENAWNSVKNRNRKRMAREITHLYNQVYKPEDRLISVIMPTKDNPEAFIDSLLAAASQDYPKFEIVIADSGEPVREIVDRVRKEYPVPIKYIHFEGSGYTLAEARNRAVVESEGEILVFCDDRIAMETTALSVFAANIKNKNWIWGIKDDSPKGFVENFSCIKRFDFISGGMFNERINRYGGMSQELRLRYEDRLGYAFELASSARAKSVKRTKSKQSRRKDIIEAKLTIFKLYG